jgi:hypothetical protein
MELTKTEGIPTDVTHNFIAGDAYLRRTWICDWPVWILVTAKFPSSTYHALWGPALEG